MSLNERKKTFKQIGNTLNHAFRQIDRGLDVLDRLGEARDEPEREFYSELVAQSVHHTWETVTRVLKRIAIDFDNGTPKGKGAPMELIRRMTQRTADRPGVISLKHLDTVQKIGQFHRDFRRAKISHASISEMTVFIEKISDEILPEILENVRVLALSAPGGVSLLQYLSPQSGTKGYSQEAYEAKISA